MSPRGAISYRAAHQRVTRKRGKAAEQTCVECGSQAHEWAFCGDPETSPRSEYGLSFSMSTDDYRPLCRACHRLERLVPCVTGERSTEHRAATCIDCKRARARASHERARNTGGLVIED